MNGESLGWRSLEPAECWALLGSVHQGYLAYSDRALPAIVPVELSVVDDGVELAGCGEALEAHAHGDIVCLHADDRSSGSSWRVSLVGRLSLNRAPVTALWLPVHLSAGVLSGARRQAVDAG
jgi:hypothetical protein